ncbi:MAG: ABC transporter ATP-binding protein [Acidimicrobiia bacterium]|nr:ABC transporter ATP-binding protein [Acidimicrobiia bacterium]
MTGEPEVRSRARFGRLRLNIHVVRSMLSLRRDYFAIAIAGAAVFAVCTIASSFAVRWIIDEVIFPRFETGELVEGAFLTGAALIIGIGILRGVAVIFRRSFASIGMWRVAESYTNQVLDQLFAQPITWHRRRADGDLVARAGVDTESAVAVIAPIPFAMSTVLMIVGTTIWLFYLDTWLGLVAVVVFPLLIGTNLVYERLVSGHFTVAQDRLGDFSAGVHESFEGVQLVKAYGAEARETARLGELAEDVRSARVQAISLRSWFEALLDVIPSLTNIALVVLGAIRVDSGDVTVGEFTSVIFLFTLLVFPIRLIGYALSELPRSRAAWLRIQAVVTEPIEPDPRGSIGSAPEGVGVVLRHVSYAYPGEDQRAVRDVDLTLSTGSVTALVGPTGAGKSTLVDLVVGLVPPTEGSVDLADVTRCIVFQEAFLLSGTIRDNVELGARLTDDAVWQALRSAEATEFVERLPHGLDTIVGERGVSLSGGQRQRLALARALSRDPGLLVLDDTTSALDPATESRVLSNLRTSFGSTTVLIVASRPSTIALADDVVYMEDGDIAAHGTHRDLMTSVERYRELVEAFETDRGGSAPGSAGERADRGAR